ncbi:MAG: hypothetical protein FJ405_11850 [Verrucomicrobia bacterium]|nr:hypothetical protein [Verrucomicrobiota bacterium]
MIQSPSFMNSSALTTRSPGPRLRSTATRAWVALILMLSVLCSNAQQQFGGQGAARGARGGGNTSASGRMYPGNGQVGEALISSDPESRRLIVITDDETSQYISQVITNLDRPKPQVLIKVVFLEVTHNDGSDIGVEGSIRKKLEGSTFGSASNLLGLATAGGLPVPPGAGLYQILGNDFQATLRAIASAGRTEVLSRPSVLTRHNQPATIMVGETLPFITNVRFDDNGNQINTVQYQDIGIILRVTPFIMPDGLVEMIVSPEISNLTEKTVTIGTGVTAPVIAKRSADTVVMTPDGQTVVIGGLMQNSKTRSTSKIPLLGDIPLLGMAFQRRIKSDAKTELLIFLTPHVVKEPNQLAGLTSREKGEVELAPKAFTEQELNKFVDGLPMKEPESSASKLKSKKGNMRPSDSRR